MPHYSRFESWTDFIAASRGKCPIPDSSRQSKRESDRGWLGCSLADAHKMANEGWLEGAERARKLTADITNIIGGLIDRIEINYDVEGHAIDIGRFVQNEPECWMRFDVEKVQQPAVRYIRIVNNITASGGVDAETLMARGAVIAALIELLEFAGNRVEVIMAEASRGGGLDWVTLANVKRFDEPLDMPKMAYAIGHPSVLRVHHFALTECEPTVRAKFGPEHGGYGCPMDVPDEDRGDIYIGRSYLGDPHWKNVDSAVAWVKKKLAEFGVKLHEPEKV